MHLDRDLILWPVAVHLLLLLILYAWLSLVRKQIRDGNGDTALEARVSANLSNQYEAPVLWYAIVVLIWAGDLLHGLFLALAWLFVAGRIMHTLVQTMTANVIHRGLVFTVNFLAVYGMWAVFLWQRLVTAQAVGVASG